MIKFCTHYILSKKIGILFFFTLNSIILSAQTTGYVNVKARAQQNAILLRWGASSPASWKITNISGFWIDRYTVLRDGVIVQSSEKIRLTEIPLKAKPLPDWESFIMQNDEAAIIAQALYGEDFSISAGRQQGFARAYAVAQDLEQRFTFSLFAADKNFEAACFAGWGFRDTTVKKGEKYLYRIIPALPENVKDSIDFGFIYVGLEDYKPLPQPLDLQAEFNDRMVVLSWDYDRLSEVYSSYDVEKSADGKQYAKLNNAPVSNMNDDANSPYISHRIVYMDSLAENDKIYYYRVIGISSFGETGMPSDAVFGKGMQALTHIPAITKALVNNKNELEIDWTFDEAGRSLIEGFELNQSVQSDKGFNVVASIAKNSSHLIYDSLFATNYFTISAVGLNGERKTSFPVLIQPLDTMPPVTPTGLKGYADTNGRLHLSWNGNHESDFYGYKVYKAFAKGETPFWAFDFLVTDTAIQTFLDVDNLNQHVYCAVVALDRNYNQSPMSELIEIEKPDYYPPTSPVISGYKVKNEGIEISWINSSSNNVIAHKIYRREKNGDTIPVILANIDKLNISTYLDASVENNIKYIYTIKAVKKSGVESPPSQPITIFTTVSNLDKLIIKRLDAVIDRQNNVIKLTWSDNLKDVASFEIYKGESVEELSLWKTVDGNTFEIADPNVQLQTTYRYLIKAIFRDGKNSKGKELRIKN